MTYRPVIVHSPDETAITGKIIQCRQCGQAWSGYPNAHTCANDAPPATFEAELLQARCASAVLARWLDELMTCPARRMTVDEIAEINAARKAVGLTEAEW